MAIEAPEYRFTFTDVSGAFRVGSLTPRKIRMLPSRRKNQPDGFLRSSIITRR
jgi:hypothetical protein